MDCGPRGPYSLDEAAKMSVRLRLLARFALIAAATVAMMLAVSGLRVGSGEPVGGLAAVEREAAFVGDGAGGTPPGHDIGPSGSELDLVMAERVSAAEGSPFAFALGFGDLLQSK